MAASRDFNALKGTERIIVYNERRPCYPMGYIPALTPNDDECVRTDCERPFNLADPYLHGGNDSDPIFTTRSGSRGCNQFGDSSPVTPKTAKLIAGASPNCFSPQSGSKGGKGSKKDDCVCQPARKRTKKVKCNTIPPDPRTGAGYPNVKQMAQEIEERVAAKNHTSNPPSTQGGHPGTQKRLPNATQLRKAGGKSEDYYCCSPLNSASPERIAEPEGTRHNPILRYKHRARSGQTEEEKMIVSSLTPTLSEYERKIPNNRKRISTQDSGSDEFCPCCGKPKSDAGLNEECEEDSRQIDPKKINESSGDAKDANISCQNTENQQDAPYDCNPEDGCNQTENCDQALVEQPRKRSGQCYQCYNCNYLQPCSCLQNPVCPETCLVIPSPKGPKFCSPCPRPCPRPLPRPQPLPCPRPCASPMCQVLCSTCCTQRSTNQECTDSQWRQSQRKKPTCGCSGIYRPKCRAPTC